MKPPTPIPANLSPELSSRSMFTFDSIAEDKNESQEDDDEVDLGHSIVVILSRTEP